MTPLPEEIALDVVLIPPGPVIDEAIRINRALLAMHPQDDAIMLDATACIPHMTVAMAAVKSRDFSAITDAIGKIAEKCSPMTLSITGISAVTVAGGRKVSGFDITRIDALQLLHKTVMHAVEPYALQETKPEMFAGYEKGRVEDTAIDCLRRFSKRSSFSNYSPHITLGYGRIPDLVPGTPFPIRFLAQRIAICHLGKHCTCRSILSSFDL